MHLVAAHRLSCLGKKTKKLGFLIVANWSIHRQTQIQKWQQGTKRVYKFWVTISSLQLSSRLLLTISIKGRNLALSILCNETTPVGLLIFTAQNLYSLTAKC